MRSAPAIPRILAVLARAAPAIAFCALTPAAGADELPLTPGLYEVDVRISLPNVQEVAEPSRFVRCIERTDLESGRAFPVLSDNPLKTCEQRDYRVTGATAVFRIVCAGPNRGSATAIIDATAAAYRGVIKMNMGGKNMTMAETQTARRIGDCR